MSNIDLRTIAKNIDSFKNNTFTDESISKVVTLKNCNNKLIKTRLLRLYITDILLRMKNYDRYVYNSLLNELQDTVNRIKITNDKINYGDILTICSSLKKEQYRNFLKENISGVKSPTDKVRILADFHTNNLKLI